MPDESNGRIIETTSTTAVTESVAIEDPPEIQKANPIHAAGGAEAYGYERPIVAGLSSYGWAAASLIELLGESWLAFGWADMAFRRPVFAGDRLVTTATLGDGFCVYEQRNEAGKITTEGRAGLGLAPFDDEWDLPISRTAAPPISHAPRLQPEQAPVGVDYPGMCVELSVEGSREWSANRLGDHHGRYQEGDAPFAHPSWVPGQMTPLIRHSYRFGAGIHTSGRVQHLRAVRAPQSVVVAGRWIANEQRKDRWWSTTDAVFSDDAGTELAYCRQTQILLPKLV